MNLIRIVPFAFLLTTAACTTGIEQDTLKNDTQAEDEASVIAQEAATDGKTAGTFIVEVDEKTAEILEGGGEITDGFSFRRVFPEAGEFEDIHREWGLHKVFFAEPKEAVPATKAIAGLESLRGVSRIEKVPKAEPEAIPFNDPMAYLQWNLFNAGTLVSTFTAGADINVVPAWENYTAGSKDVIVGVVDTGIDYSHSDLAGVVFPAGPDGSKSFLYSTLSNPYTITGQRHGTHVAGIIAAVNNNGTGVCGIAGGRDGSGGVRLLDLQAIRTVETDGGNTYDAMVWAADHGAVILNNSWNYVYDQEANVPDDTDYATRLAIDYFISRAGTDKEGNQTGPMKGGLVLFSAGNNGWSKGQPAMYEKVVAVGATGPANDCASYTNYGDWVDICAPGGNAKVHGTSYGQIMSTVSGSSYASMQGTSMACPAVSGVAALILSRYGGPGFTADRLREMLLAGANREAESGHLREIGPLVDAYESISYKDKELLPVTDLSVSCRKTSATVSFPVKAYGNESVHFYRVFVSENRSDLENLDPFDFPASMRSRRYSTATWEAGEVLSAEFSSLTRGRDYYCTAIGYTRSHRYSKGNAIAKFTIPANSAPVVTFTDPGEIRLNHNQQKNLYMAYSDEDGDKLTVSVSPGSAAVSSTDDGKGHISISINGADAPAGSYKITVRVTDGHAPIVHEILYTILPNRYPALAVDFTGRSMEKGGELELDLNGIFSDEDGDELAFSWSHDEDIVAGVLENGILTIHGDRKGICLIGLDARDGHGGKAEKYFMLRVDDPADGGMLIFPESVKDKLYISASKAGSTPIRIENSEGRAIFSKTVVQDPYTPYYVDMRKCPPGIYTVRVENDGKVTEKRIVKR